MAEPSYSAIETVRLSLALPELKAAERELRIAAAREGITYVIPAFGGTRTPEEQAQLEKWRDESDLKADGKLGPDTAGWYPVAGVDTGLHPVGAAFDAHIVRDGKRVPDGDAAYKRLADIAESIGLDAGYYFKRRDQFHFQLRVSREYAEKRFKETTAQRLALGGGTLAVVALVGWLVWPTFSRGV